MYAQFMLAPPGELHAALKRVSALPHIAVAAFIRKQRFFAQGRREFKVRDCIILKADMFIESTCLGCFWLE